MGSLGASPGAEPADSRHRDAVVAPEAVLAVISLDDWVIAASEALDACGLGEVAETMLEHGSRACDTAEAALIERAKFEAVLYRTGAPIGFVLAFHWDPAGLLALGRVCTVRREAARAAALDTGAGAAA